MPLIRFDLLQGRSDQEISALLDAAHRAVVSAFEVPERDRYQIVQEHQPGRLIVQDTGLGIDRTDKVVVVTVVSRPRSQVAKLAFYADLVRELHEHAGVDPADVVVSIVENSDADWSFGYGRAQFVTAEL
ncbi:tautomerase family protein [Mycobacterium sp. SMC-14]|uniref:tautomerase family protein n=1 Tax=Mycobacterium sp. SMC-14 TaxID=3385968 RepID=UPI00390C8088